MFLHAMLPAAHFALGVWPLFGFGFVLIDGFPAAEDVAPPAPVLTTIVVGAAFEYELLEAAFEVVAGIEPAAAALLAVVGAEAAEMAPPVGAT